MAQTHSPLSLQNVFLAFRSLVAGILVLLAPAQNQPLTLTGWKVVASHPLPGKLHLRPDE
jgi:hypothetical protein